ncbi:response regulator transcription factor [Streptomyces sp. NPDC050560]|uniref:response regulator transcription factor n=1 Tax=Streptomyces sp. NPDC050560 TaxID=3365630 RepID=UPI00379389D7
MAAEPAVGAEIRSALLRMRRTSGLPVAFGGPVDAAGRRVRIGELSGNTTDAITSLAVSTGNGLGGKAVALSRPCAVTDYQGARTITHEYDRAVAAEGLKSVLAVPVVVRRRVRAVLYGALRTAEPLGERMLDEAVSAARDVEQSIVAREEAGAVLAGMAGPEPGEARGDGAWERVREAHGALRTLAARVGDPALRDELLDVCDRLVTAAGNEAAPAGLAPREIDVLACVASGATNAGAAERLGLRPETVKAYLRSAMRRLGAHTRLEAVHRARSAGLLP